MKLPRRNFLHLAAGAAALPAVSRFAWAQAYPSRPVRMIVPIAPGGAQDILARLMGQWLSERLGQPFVIDNRPGGGSNIGTEAVVRAPADGHTLLLIPPDSAINATLYDKLNFNFIRDIAPVAGVFRGGQDSSRAHRLCQGQSRQNQHGVCWHRKRPTYSGRVVQDDGRGQHGSCALSRRRARVDRSARRTGNSSDPLPEKCRRNRASREVRFPAFCCGKRAGRHVLGPPLWLGGRVLGLPCGSPIARLPLPISCDVLPAREGIGCVSVS
jgi:hypothetical protein